VPTKGREELLLFVIECFWESEGFLLSYKLRRGGRTVIRFYKIVGTNSQIFHSRWWESLKLKITYL